MSQLRDVFFSIRVKTGVFLLLTSCSPKLENTGVVTNSDGSRKNKATTIFTYRTDTVINIGSRKELFVDDLLIQELKGTSTMRLHEPVPQEISLVHDQPWEGAGSGYYSVFQDGSRYRMYYKMWQRTPGPGYPNTDKSPLLTGYAESDDGIHWRKPNLGLFDFKGSKENNIVIAGGSTGAVSPDAGHPAVFKDENPDVSPDALYKALMPEKFDSGNPKGLIAYKSPDGIHWTPLISRPLISAGAFDSQNIAFWDSNINMYRAYWRANNKVPASEENLSGVRRDVRTSTSKDFINWTEWEELKYTDSPLENLYVSQIKPYFRAPHIYIGFPVRYFDRGWSESMRALPDSAHRAWRSKPNSRLGTALSESLLMASHDGRNFKLWRDAFLKPGIERTGTWSYGGSFIGWQVVETKSSLPGAPNELSLYASENYWSGPAASALRRYTLRMDGFVSINASNLGGDIITRPLKFSGKKLFLNFSSSIKGDIRVELQDKDGRPLEGFSIDKCDPVFGDAIERAVIWVGAVDLSSLEGKVVRLRFSLKDADLYAFQFK